MINKDIVPPRESGLTDEEMYNRAVAVKKASGVCCLFKAQNALMAVNWDANLAIKLIAEQDRLKSDFDINEFRRKYVKN